MRKNAVLPHSLGKKLHRLRKSQGLTQEELANKAHLTPTYIGFIEQARSVPSLEALQKIANALHVKISELL